MAQRDSVVLKPVTVYGMPDEKYLAGSTIVSIDSTLQKSYTSNHLGEVLSLQFPVYFRNYGNGMISGISMRGTSPQHTAVLWNGININSFSLGQADFSILPMTAFKNIKVHEGGGSARFGSGAFGGSVLLNSSPNHSPAVSLTQQVGSFGRYATSTAFSFRVSRFTSSTTVYHLQSQNNFRVNNTSVRQPHAAYLQKGVVQAMKYTLAGNRNLDLNYWFHDADREVQPNVGSYSSSDEQQDRNHRLSLSYSQNDSWGAWKASAGMVDDVIVFNHKKSEILRWIGSINHQYTLARTWHLQWNSEWNHIIGKIEEYGGEPQENRIDVAAFVQKDVKKHSFSLHLRQPFISKVNAPFLPYLGASFLLAKKASHRVTGLVNASKNFRAPTFNDRYWQNAGDRNLKPETSHAAETGLQWEWGQFQSNAKGFYQLVDQWIQWVPDASGNFRPRNIKQVKTRGLEGSLEGQWKMTPFVFHARLAYQYVHSTTSKASSVAEEAFIGKQLIYTPLHTGNASLSVLLNNWSLQVFAQYAGKRFTDASNGDLYALKQYLLVDFSMEKKLVWKRNDFLLQLSMKNAFNETYQMYSGRAMPGRYFNGQISYQLQSK